MKFNHENKMQIEREETDRVKISYWEENPDCNETEMECANDCVFM